MERVEKKIVEKISGGDAEFKNAINRFFPKNKTKLQIIEEKTGIPFNDGKTEIGIKWDFNIAKYLSIVPKSE